MRAPRAGATLMEVLISMAIMAIGVIGVAALFPISLMHSVRAHQLTSGTVHRYTAESLLDVARYIYQNPDQDPATSHSGQAYLFDPLGTSDSTPPLTTPPTPSGYGLQAGPNAVGTLTRYPDGSATSPRWTLPVADDFATALDTWVEVYRARAQGDVDPQDGTLTLPGLGNAGVTIAATADSFPRTRAVMFYDDPISGRRKSAVREVSGTDANTDLVIDSDQLQLILSTPPPPPDTTLPVVVDEVRLEQQDRRFSWLLTVRRGGSISNGTTTQHAAEIDVVIFFNRTFSPEDEVTTWANFQDGNDTVDIRWTGQRPRLRRGGWVLDADSGNWYQISDYSESGNQATLTLTGSARATSPVVGGTNTPDGKAAFMRAVVDVYRLEPKSWITTP